MLLDMKSQHNHDADTHKSGIDRTAVNNRQVIPSQTQQAGNSHIGRAARRYRFHGCVPQVDHYPNRRHSMTIGGIDLTAHCRRITAGRSRHRPQRHHDTTTTGSAGRSTTTDAPAPYTGRLYIHCRHSKVYTTKTIPQELRAALP